MLFLSESVRMRTPFSPPRTNIRKSLNKAIFIVLVIAIVFSLFYLPLLEEETSRTRVSKSKLSQLQEILAKTRNFAISNNVSFSYHANDSANARFFYEIMGEKKSYAREVEEGVFNFSSPEELLNYYYNVELNKHNFEAELQLQAGYLPHNPLFSSTFNDRFHALRRGYGQEGSVFVALLPSFDSRCAETVESIFANAFYPTNIFVGVLDGYPGDTQHCTPSSFQKPRNQESMQFTFNDNLRIRRVKGVGNFSLKIQKNRSFFLPDDPMRFSTLELYRGESYILFIRSGTRLLPGWDWRLKLMYLYEPNKDNTILTSAIKLPVDELKEAFEEGAMSSVFSPRSVSGDMKGNLTFDKTTSELVDVFQGCSFCLVLLVLPRECLSAALKEKIKEALDNTTGEPLEIMNALSEGNTSVLNSRWMVDYETSTFSDAKEFVFRKTRRIRSQWDLEREIASVGFSFSISQCTGGFNAKEKRIYKNYFEHCWFEENSDSLLRLFLKKVNDSKTVEVPSVSSVQTDTVTRTERVPRTSTVLEDMNYISLNVERVSSLNVSSQKIVSLEFLFSRSEAFINISRENRIAFADLQKEKESETISFDPFLPALTPYEADLLASAKLWTSGWNFKRLTEPLGISFDFNDADTNLLNTTNAYVQKAREVTIRRLQSIFNNSGDTSHSVTKKYTLGNQRSLKDFLLFTGMETVDFT